MTSQSSRQLAVVEQWGREKKKKKKSPLAGTERKQQSLTEGGGGGIAGSPFRIPLSHFAILSLAVAAESRMPGLIPDTSSHHEVGHEENFFSVLIDGPEWVLQVKRAHKLEGCRKNLYGP